MPKLKYPVRHAFFFVHEIMNKKKTSNFIRNFREKLFCMEFFVGDEYKTCEPTIRIRFSDLGRTTYNFCQN